MEFQISSESTKLDDEANSINSNKNLTQDLVADKAHDKLKLFINQINELK